jgi:hypothetical protein
MHQRHLNAFVPPASKDWQAYEWQPGDFIRHFAGCPWQERVCLDMMHQTLIYAEEQLRQARSMKNASSPTATGLASSSNSSSSTNSLSSSSFTSSLAAEQASLKIPSVEEILKQNLLPARSPLSEEAKLENLKLSLQKRMEL